MSANALFFEGRTVVWNGHMGVVVENPRTRSDVRIRLAGEKISRTVAASDLTPLDAPDGTPMVTRPTELIETEKTLLDILAVSDDAKRKDVGKPRLTLAINVATRCIVGSHLSLDVPTSTSGENSHVS
ncbi:hypothetical protein [Rhodanobacter denitrificans]|uniref:hypothetical protein n=1 Tax=Rhodanobacter denitrificans TaxID=666685 RepID=UPI0011C07442|nr:hypothetical protein [Rhodanobacter denitrificans]